MITQPIVLMYHGIVAPQTPIPRERETGADLYDVTVENFHAQLGWLKEHLYRAITVRKNLNVFSTKGDPSDVRRRGNEQLHRRSAIAQRIRFYRPLFPDRQAHR